MLCQESFNIPDLRIHLAFHITDIRHTSVVEYALVMHQSGIVSLMEQIGHGLNVLTAKGFVTAGKRQESPEYCDLVLR